MGIINGALVSTCLMAPLLAASAEQLPDLYTKRGRQCQVSRGEIHVASPLLTEFYRVTLEDPILKDPPERLDRSDQFRTFALSHRTDGVALYRQVLRSYLSGAACKVSRREAYAALLALQISGQNGLAGLVRRVANDGRIDPPMRFLAMKMIAGGSRRELMNSLGRAMLAERSYDDDDWLNLILEVGTTTESASFGLKYL